MDRGAAEAVTGMKVFYSRDSAKIDVIAFPVMIGIGGTVFLGDTSRLQQRYADHRVIFIFAGLLVGAVLLLLARISFSALMELLFFRRYPALTFQEEALYFRRPGRAKPKEIPYADIGAFRLEEARTSKGGVSTSLFLFLPGGDTVYVDCDRLELAPLGLFGLLEERAPGKGENLIA